MITSINVISNDLVDTRCTNAYRVDRLADVREILAKETFTGSPRSLDLIGHSTRDHHLLRLGISIIDMVVPSTAEFFRDLKRDELLQAAGVVRVRLLGCDTAVRPAGQRTMRRLANILGIPVYGSCKPILKSHYNAAGFDPLFRTILVEAAPLA